MGYRERRAHKQQQKQQSLGQAYTPEQRVSLPAPTGMNTRDNPASLSPMDAALLEDAVYTDGGLLIKKQPVAKARTSTTSFTGPLALITYEGCGSTSAEMWAVLGTKIYNVGEAIDSGIITSASAISAPSASAAWNPAMWTEFNKTIIMVNGSWPLKWNRASAWEPWSATASGEDIKKFWGINKFKSRLIGWEKDDSKFWYASTDQVLGTFNSFDLSQVIDGSLLFMANMTRDGGAGPDDYAVFVADNGDTAVYTGQDPSDGQSWSLVGTYKIGSPLGRSSFINYGQQLVILCEDDFYFLPQDLMGKKQSTKAAEGRTIDGKNKSTINAVYYPAKGTLIFSDGSVLSVRHNDAYSTITLSSADPWGERTSNNLQAFANGYQRPILAKYRNKIYAMPNKANNVIRTVNEVFPTNLNAVAADTKCRIKLPPIKTSGRTNISLVNPVFKTTYPSTASAAAAAPGLKFIYRTAVIYDDETHRYATASADAWTTFTASTDSNGLWSPGFGTGDNAQVVIEVLTASTSAGARQVDFFLTEIKVTASDTGGI